MLSPHKNTSMSLLFFGGLYTDPASPLLMMFFIVVTCKDILALELASPGFVASLVCVSVPRLVTVVLAIICCASVSIYCMPASISVVNPVCPLKYSSPDFKTPSINPVLRSLTMASTVRPMSFKNNVELYPKLG